MHTLTELASALTLFAIVFPARAQQSPTAPAPNARLEGRVTDQRGEPIPLAEVWVASLVDPEHIVARSRCDGQGLFLLPRVGVAGPWWISATADGMAVTTQYVGRLWGPSRVRLHEAARITGVVRDHEGKPVAGAPVRASLVATRMAFGAGDEAVTDEHGVFAIGKAPLGEVALLAIVPGGFATARRFVRADCEAQLAPDASPQTELHVEVTGLTAERLRGVRFELRPQNLPQSLPAPWARPVLDGHGRSDLAGLPDQTYLVRFAAPGLTFAPTEVQLTAGKGPHRLAVTTNAADAPTQLWSGILGDAAGSRLEDVALVLRNPHTGASVATRTGARGEFRFECPWPKGTKCWIAADDERYVLDQAKSELAVRMMPSAQHQHETVFDPDSTLRLRAIAACQVSGRVLRADGTPALLATVRLECWSDQRRPAWAEIMSTTTDQEGRYTIRGVHDIAAPVRVAVTDEAGAAEGEGFALDRTGTRITAPDLRLSATATIQGVVRNAAGEPQPGIAVWLRDWDPNNGSPRSGALTEVLTDRGGRYRFLGVPVGGAYLEFGDRPTTFTLNRPFGPGPLNNLRALVPAAQAHVGEPFEVKTGESLTVDLLR